jgi:hypothetical protein
MKSVEDLDVFKLAHQLALKTYSTTKTFPKAETFSLVDQMRRAAISVGMNLMEGAMRLGSREYGSSLASQEARPEKFVTSYFSLKICNTSPTNRTRSCSRAMIVSSKCFPVSHRASIVKLKHEQDHV